jgi:photosystem II oxygen-evolving enhancer protein 2
LPSFRYEDNFDAVNNVAILNLPSDKGSIDGYGAPEKFLEQVNFLFGKQNFSGEEEH